MVETVIRVNQIGRRKAARSRLERARGLLRCCRLCAHECGVDRSQDGAQGFCHAGPVAKVFSAQTEVSDELELIPTFAVAFSGCDLRCEFCITGAESWNASAGARLDAKLIAAQAAAAIQRGARSMMILGGEPTIHLPSVLELVAELPETLKLIWKTNGHGAAIARELLDGLFDVWLVDYKFGNDACAEKLAHVPDYSRAVRENLRWAAERGELLVRHLLMPGHVDCCWQPVAAWLAESLPGIKVNLRTGFWPAWRAQRHDEFRSFLSEGELERSREIAERFNLCLVQ